MLDYDLEAASYDESRGGRARAVAAAYAVLSLAPGGGTCLDVGGGTGIVSGEIAQRGYDVVVLDRSVGMLDRAAARVPGRTVLADASELPVASGSVDLALTLWLLHLVTPELADRVIAQVAGVVRRGGVWVTSVDKAASHGQGGPAEPDQEDRLVARASAHGLAVAGRASFEARTPYGTGSTSDVATFRLVGFSRERT